MTRVILPAQLCLSTTEASRHRLSCTLSFEQPCTAGRTSGSGSKAHDSMVERRHTQRRIVLRKSHHASCNIFINITARIVP